MRKKYGMHTNYYESMQIIKVFIENNFSIDVLDVREINYKELLKTTEYDIIFGLGNAFYYACNQCPKALKIIYMTEFPPVAAKQNFLKRVEYYQERHGKRKTGIMRDDIYQEDHLKAADIGIIISNEYNSKKFNMYFLKKYILYPSGLINPNYVWQKKNSISKKHFVWFGGSGAIHKGLDILLDVFSKEKVITLHVCGLNRKEKRLFCISKLNNVIDHGFVDVQSDRFINEIINSCGFVILPSCAEGVSTGVITCMLHGLIPVVTKECGIDVFDFGYTLDSYLVEDVASLLLNLSSIDDINFDYKSEFAFKFARNNFKINNFADNIRTIFNDILSNI
jgi:glycosyltransferase involved in cell wall biosynthesis